jgi:hypothetical protein
MKHSRLYGRTTIRQKERRQNICFFSKYGGRKSPNHDSEFVEAGIRNSRILLDGFSHVGFGRLLGTLKTKSRTINTV